MPAAINTTIATYLTQWLKIASGDRVVMTGTVDGFGGFSGQGKGWVRFKCMTCLDNWNVGSELFYSGKDPVGIPSVLQEWVAKHRHVCTKYTGAASPGYLVHSPCLNCKWPYSAHDVSWMDQVTDQVPNPNKQEQNTVSQIDFQKTLTLSAKFALAQKELEWQQKQIEWQQKIATLKSPQAPRVKVNKVEQSTGRRFRDE